AFFYRASLGGPDERREQKFATLVGDHFGMSPTNILLTLRSSIKYTFQCCYFHTTNLPLLLADLADWQRSS
ncbi:hypothetical protein P4543_13860, partial [Geobacillus stearothermophilus]|nr:hypothetical protein [Geobacillus stearothermophilus]